MAMRMRISHILKEMVQGTPLVVTGWVRTIRVAKNVSFITLNDGSCLAGLQVVFDTNLPGYADVCCIGTGSAIKVTGVLNESPATGQSMELQAGLIEIIGNADESYPLQKKQHSFEFLRTIAHLRPKANTFGAVFRTRSALSFAVHNFFHERGFIYVHTPIITGNDCEGAGETFRVTTLDFANLPLVDQKADFNKDFFGQPAGLTVSGQLEGELLAMGLSSIYTFGPTFRAEDSNTARHAAEFWMIEPELAFADLDDMIELAGDFLRYLCRYTLNHCTEDMAFFDRQIEPGLIKKVDALANATFERIDYTEAISLLEKAPVSYTHLTLPTIYSV